MERKEMGKEMREGMDKRRSNRERIKHGGQEGTKDERKHKGE